MFLVMFSHRKTHARHAKSFSAMADFDSVAPYYVCRTQLEIVNKVCKRIIFYAVNLSIIGFITLPLITCAPRYLIEAITGHGCENLVYMCQHIYCQNKLTDKKVVRFRGVK